MAVDKELYERYKAAKAQGQNITLAELKAQLEQERAGGYSASSYEEPAETISIVQNNYSSSTYTTTQTMPAQEPPKILTPTITYQTPIQEPEPVNNNSLKRYALIGYPLGHSLS